MPVKNGDVITAVISAVDPANTNLSADTNGDNQLLPRTSGSTFTLGVVPFVADFNFTYHFKPCGATLDIYVNGTKDPALTYVAQQLPGANGALLTPEGISFSYKFS